MCIRAFVSLMAFEITEFSSLILRICSSALVSKRLKDKRKLHQSSALQVFTKCDPFCTHYVLTWCLRKRDNAWLACLRRQQTVTSETCQCHVTQLPFEAGSDQNTKSACKRHPWVHTPARLRKLPACQPYASLILQRCFLLEQDRKDYYGGSPTISTLLM